jgi:hypothetical protein
MHRAAIGLALTLALVTPARAQFNQYSAPGSKGEEPEDAAQLAEQAAAEARWRFGRLRLEPHLNLTDVGYVRNVFSATEGSQDVNDAHATLGAGLAGYIRLGSKSLFTGYVAPRYFWWQDSKELRELALSSGLAWFGDFNRLQISAIARESESQRQLSSEVEVPARISDEILILDASLAITRSVALFAQSTDTGTRHSLEVEQFVPGLALRSLDRDTKRQTLGFELRGKHLELGLGYEKSEVDFVTPSARDNTGRGPLLRLEFARDRLHVNAEYSDLEFEFDSPATPRLNQVVGSALISFSLRPRTTASLFLSDQLAFTTISTEGIIESNSQGISLRQDLGERLEADLFGETGTQTFDDPQNPGRTDELEAFGLTLRFDLTERLTLTATLRDQRWNSTFSEFDRSSSSLGLGVEVGGDLLPW